MLKKAIGWTLAWAFFWLGDLVSRVIDLFDPQTDWLCSACYWCYNKPMLLSNRLQDWGGAGPWMDVPIPDEQQFPE